MKKDTDAKFQFGNIVVVEDNLIGVIVKTWNSVNSEVGFSYEVYVRSYNNIHTYLESDIKHFVYSKELAEDEEDFYE